VTSPAPPAEPRWTALPHLDREAAARILEAAGWGEVGSDGIRRRDGVPLRISMLYDRSNDFRELLAALLEQDLARVGILLEPVPLDGPTLWTRCSFGQFETALLGFRPPTIPDPSALWASWGYWNLGGYASARVDSLCAALEREESPKRVLHLARQIESTVRIGGPVTFLVYREWAALLGPRVRDFDGISWDPLRGLENTWTSDSLAASGRSRRAIPVQGS
jgi:ABC-type transport system substrate-binding protein